MKKLLLLLFCSFLAINVLAQKADLPQRKYSSWGSVFRINNDRPVFFKLGYSHLKLNNLEASDADLLASGGFFAQVGTNIISPLEFSAGYSSNLFKTNGLGYAPLVLRGEKLHFQKLDVGFNFTQFFSKAKVSFGGGMDWMFLSVGKHFTDEAVPDMVRTESKSAPYWKTGLEVNVSSNIRIGVSYRQSVDVGNAFSYSQALATVAATLDGETWLKDEVKEDFKYKNAMLVYSYHVTRFQNRHFKELIENGDIETAYGHELFLRLNPIYPIILDIGGFYSQFKVKNQPNWNYADSIKVSHRGLEVAVSLPIISLTKYFIPYLGLGYQVSQLYIGPPLIKDPDQDYSNVIERTVNMSSPIWKIGVMINTKKLSFQGTYKHSINLKEKAFDQISAGVGWRFM